MSTPSKFLLIRDVTLIDDKGCPIKDNTDPTEVCHFCDTLAEAFKIALMPKNQCYGYEIYSIEYKLIESQR